MNHEMYYWVIQSLRTKLTCGLCTLASLILLGTGAGLEDERLQTTAYASSCILAAVSLANNTTKQEAEDALEDYRVSASLRRQQSLLTGSAPSSKQRKLAEEQLKFFDWESIGERRNDFPNVIVVGKPGTGKTSVAEYLGCLLKTDKRYAIHPHKKPGDFAGFNAVFGGGRNYGTAEDEPLAWSDCVNAQEDVTIAQVLTAALDLMNERYQAYYRGESAFETIDLYIDELPSIVSNLGQKFLAPILKQLLMESRKVGIRLFLLAQGGQVRLLGMEGASSLRDGCTFIRLGDAALAEGRRLVRTKELLPSAFDYLKQCERPALVDDTLAKLPGWSEMQGAIAAFSNDKGQTRDNTVTEAELVYIEADENSSHEGTTRDTGGTLMMKFDGSFQSYSRTSVMSMVNEAINARDYRKLRQLVVASNEDKEVMRTIGYRLVSEQAQSVSSVIKEGWGFEGRNYQRGKDLYTEFRLYEVAKTLK